MNERRATHGPRKRSHITDRWKATALGATIAGLACAPKGPPAFPPADPSVVARNEAAGDPYRGRFPLGEALAGLGDGSSLWATIETDAGSIPCELDLYGKPLTVANFVGLARGVRPVRGPDGRFAPLPYYEGSVFHRTHRGQFVQGGLRPDLEDPGFVLQDEVSPGDDFRDAGVLAMANRGPNTGAAEFFVTLGGARHLAGRHTPFGDCRALHVVSDLSERVARGERPRILRVEITRTAPKGR